MDSRPLDRIVTRSTTGDLGRTIVGLPIEQLPEVKKRTNDLVAQAGGAAEGLYLYSLRMLSPESVRDSDPAKAAITQLATQYQQKYNVVAPVYAQHAYDAFLILEQAMNKINGPVNRESIRAAIEKVEVNGTNGSFRFSPQNHGGLDANSQSFVMLRSVKGKWMAVD